MKLKPWVKITFLIIIVILVIWGGTKFLGKKTPQENNNSSLLEKYNIPKDKYSKTLEFALQNNIYEEKYLDEYAQINYSDKDNFLDILSTFLPKGYKGKEINYIMELSSNNVEKLKNIEYIDIQNYYSFKNFNVDNIQRYNKYYEQHSDFAYKDIVTYVNIKLDLPVYTDTTQVTDTESELVLVNKYNYLPTDYKPSDLEYVKGYYGDQVPMKKVTKEAFIKLQEAAKEENKMDLMATTAFRTHAKQSTLYNNYVAKNGKEKADTFSARPGYSEHQTGLAIDLKNPARRQGERLSDEDYEWLKNNAHRFGFIVRYKKDKEFITGYEEEDWHIRYVGIEAASKMYEENLCLEEYVDLYQTTY